MHAVVKVERGAGKIELRDVPEPVTGPDQVKIEVKAAGICGTDLHIWHGEFPCNPPVILGHEFCGVVAEVGDGVTGVKVGDKVTSETAGFVCGTCICCRTGNYNLCDDRLGLGCGMNGAFTRYCVVRAAIVHKLPESIPYDSGALCEPLSCCVHCVTEQTGIAAGDLVVIHGAGVIGLLSLQIAKAEGGRVIVLGLSADRKRLEIARQLGADHTVNVEEADARETVKALSDGRGADVVLECSGTERAVSLGLDVIRKRGTFTQMGLFGHPIRMELEKVVTKELRLCGSVSQKWTAWERALRLLNEGTVKTAPLVTDRFPLTRWEEAFRKLETKQCGKILLIPE